MQVVGYDTGTPALFVSTSDGIDSVDLDPGTELDYRLEDRHCAGTIHDDRHIPCDNDGAPYCPDHRSTWVCAKCTGTCLKDEMDCYEDHAVYLAAFAPNTFKVGVTRHWRVETRLREQGADRAAHIRTFSDGRVAREYEAELATEISDRIRVPTKISGFGREVDADAWESLLAEFDPIETFSFDYGLDLSGSPVAETIATGTIRGVKGRVLVLDHGGTAYAVDMRDLVGHELERGGTDRDLQSSLGAFS
ncbi:DUF2797 domain-containing protein [Haloferax mediterranei ATCC 33500]|uniref:DUF2797 domain-containing protein n=1 Tax=Haloferax mediterranei (strain ATCC 33500 / DSM 1411 / JCM 8866 / NBRC 14739 / NCIMB 2177 / R-4) TaxID=523841 RepID=I3R3T6_HALMT|nr:DUF2797 domain-containing protein [Haloferax mediterranei]AFK18896.1 hypothetical protein HFX_1183 [Haloferax mediterranei ATCC 33500]AHZ21739.1 hypothetical protein BM92_03280 [Haloferax mediterranei ATCC 33500]EMA03245.1 hypothetical protein C439_04585 [Haloferax mediterranei ATCC 33500]MDX5988990.1 DUF2797 domain-containing protein [Haloferax mediterranei ATCC 33500]QCQ75383.1 DUF2797 domain-containing protein [Haloferax mediterranei ATCC 33500]